MDLPPERETLTLFDSTHPVASRANVDFPRPPRMPYQGNKWRLLPWLWSQLDQLSFNTVLDAFGGTASVAYMLKCRGKLVTVNDYLRANYLGALALIENPGATLSHEEIDTILTPAKGRHYDDLIARAYDGIYFLAAENKWLDTTAQNIAALQNPWQRAIAYRALFQACVAKRPYNLFHRKNLYMRTAQVDRSFGNKASWDRSFEEHFHKYVGRINEAILAAPNTSGRALWGDARDVAGTFDLVYIDPPYVTQRGVGVDYFAFYHFLEGLSEYDDWKPKIDWGRKHRPLRGTVSPWSDKHRTTSAFVELFERFSQSTLAISYRSDGIPSEDTLVRVLRDLGRSVHVERHGRFQYALSKNRSSEELLIIAE